MPVPLAAVVEVAKAARVVEVEDLAPGEGKEIPLGERGTAAVEERDRPATEAMKTAAFLRHGGRCAVCGSESELRTHHFDSAADGGKTVVRKLLLVCLRCHANLHGGVTHLWMDASEGLIPLDRDGAPLQKEGGPAAVLRDAGETYPLVVIKKVSWGEAGPDPGATPRVEPAGAAPAGDSGGLRQLPQDDSRELSQPVPDTSQDDSRELCPPVPPPAAFDSLDDLPAEVTAAEWRSLSGRLEWSSARRSFVLRSEWSGVWVHSPTILPPEVDSRESSFKSEMASRNDLRKADALTASALRPGALEGFIGQKRTVENLLVAIRAAGKRGEPLSHVLLSGPPGLGKTTLSRLVARELGTGFHPAVGTHLEEPHEIIALLAGLGPRDVLFIDEVHGLRKACQECLYGALEDGIADVAISEGLRARALRIRLEPFTLIGATTELGALSEPFRSRFALEERLEFYSEADLARVAAEAAPQLKVSLHPRASAAIARRARGSPREGLRLLGRTRDVFQARKAEVLDAAIAIEARDVEAAARGLEIDADGLNQGDRRILDLLAKAKRPMGLEAIAAALRMDAQTLKVVHEPYLLERGYIARGPRGREATRTGRLRASGRTLIFDGKSIPIVGMLRFA